MINAGKQAWTTALLLASTTALLAGCTGTKDGNALPAISTEASTSSSADPFNGLHACAVLDKALEGEGFPASHVDKAGGDNGCGSDKPGFGGLGLTLDDQQGIDAFTGSGVQTGNINGVRPARIERNWAGSEGACMIVMEVTKTSRVALSISLRVSTDEACTFLDKIAERIDPQLPKAQ